MFLRHWGELSKEVAFGNKQNRRRASSVPSWSNQGQRHYGQWTKLRIKSAGKVALRDFHPILHLDFKLELESVMV